MIKRCHASQSLCPDSVGAEGCVRGRRLGTTWHSIFAVSVATPHWRIDFKHFALTPALSPIDRVSGGEGAKCESFPQFLAPEFVGEVEAVHAAFPQALAPDNPGAKPSARRCECGAQEHCLRWAA